MPILTNTTDQPIRASTGHTVPPEGTLAVSANTLERIGKEPYIALQLRKGALTIAADPAPEPAPEPLTREAVARMKRAELLEVLDTHGVTEDQVEGKYVDDLREMVARVVFVDL